MKKIAVYLFVLVGFVACKKQSATENPTNQPANNDPLASVAMGNVEYDARFFLFNSKFHASTNNVQFEGSAAALGMQSDIGVVRISNGLLANAVSFRGAQYATPYKIVGLSNDYLIDGYTLQLNSAGNTQFDSLHLELPSVSRVELNNISEGDTLDLAKGIHVEWNAQSASNGVGLFVELLQDESSAAFPGNQYPNYIGKQILTEDDGAYQISTQELAEFPEEAILEVYVVRANYVEHTDSKNKKVLFSTYSLDRVQVMCE